ncbi:hypothetical protein K8R03_01050 [Candidatus Kaiserbacteria bacterium]|nr:hypothetical protein [Candidatus Kaiserbacteria bacterium]
MDDELRSRLDALEVKVDAAYNAAEKVRKYLFWTGVVTVALVVLPAVGLVFAIPSFISTYSSLSDLSQ